MRKKSFTLMEVLTVLIIIGVLATLGVPAILNVVEESKAKVCEQNLKALKEALDIYAMENDELPSSLGMLPQEYIQRGYAKVISQRDKSSAWKIKLAQFFSDCQHKGLAYAEIAKKKKKGLPTKTKPINFLTHVLAKDNLNMVSCPLDKESPIRGGERSYGLNSILKNMTSQAYRNLAGDTLLIGDCENPDFSNLELLAKRHKRSGSNFGLIITKDGRICVVDKKRKKVYYPGDARYKELHPWE